jgi:hypothetical protein
MPSALPRKTRRQLLDELSEAVTDLVEAQEATERYYVWSKMRHKKWRMHHTAHPSLLDMLRERAEPSTQRGDIIGGGRRSGDAPPAPVDMRAVGALSVIRHNATVWLGTFGAKPSTSLDDDLVRLRGYGERSDQLTLVKLVRSVRAMRSTASTVAGWEVSPDPSGVRCPNCGKLPGPHRGLRIWLEKERAGCLSCGYIWQSGQLAILARRIEAEQRGQDAPAPVSETPAGVPVDTGSDGGEDGG